MPRKYRKGKKRAVRRKRKSRTTTISRSLAPISPRLITKFKYSQNINTSLTADVANDQQFHLNSLYDPDLTGTGHQPMGFDQLKTLYNRYRVFATRWVIEAFNTIETDVVYITAVPTNDATGLGDVGQLHETPRSQSRMISPLQKAIIRGKVYLPALNGKTSTQYKTDDKTQALINADPAEVMSLHVSTFSKTSGTVRYTVSLWYFCELFDPLQLSQS